MGSIVPAYCCANTSNEDAKALEAEIKNYRAPTMRDVQDIPARISLKKESGSNEISPKNEQ